MRAYVGLGSNLGDRETTMRHAIELLGGDGIEVVAISEFRETDPVGYVDQPRFLNAAVAVETELAPRQLLDRLLAVEQKLGRSGRAAARTAVIDLDLLVYGDEIVDEPGLRVPHPRLAERRFALEPLADLDAALVVAGLGPVSALLAGLE